jgi:hypothetical protein
MLAKTRSWASLVVTANASGIETDRRFTLICLPMSAAG